MPNILQMVIRLELIFQISFPYSSPPDSSSTIANADTSQPTVSDLTPGEYVFNLTIGDGTDTSTDSVTVIVRNGEI